MMYQRSLFALFIVMVFIMQGCTMDPKTNPVNADDTVTQNQQTNSDEQPVEQVKTPIIENLGGTTQAATNLPIINGTYRFADKYMTPGGEEPMDVTITVQDNIITDIVAKNVAILPKSVSYQNKFIEGIQGMVVGKNIRELDINHVNGSSLTAQAFNKALDNLKAQ